MIDQEYEEVALAQGAGNLDVDDSMRYVMERVLGATGGYPLPVRQRARGDQQGCGGVPRPRREPQAHRRRF